jgi:hypothetical protein
MEENARPGVGVRLWLALVLPWRVLFDSALAGRALRALSPAAPALEVTPASEAAPAQGAPGPTPAPVRADLAPAPTAALQLLGLLQREGRLIDFLQDAIDGYSDADIGAAARVVHAGCRKALADHVVIAAVRGEPEGSAIALPPGFDATRNRVTGNVIGGPPYQGRLAHPGWEVKSIDLPRLAAGHDAHVIAPAEVEI